ncbi:MAG: PrgI family protein [Actinobacteria bacterium]|nr:PrgI family protein [Actinomycetota bacterium]
MAVYGDYSRDRIGWFFGLTGPQMAVLGATALPVFFAVNRQDWRLAGSLIVAWAALFVLVAVPIRGRSFTGWLMAGSAFTVARVAGWSRFRSRASVGKTRDLAEVDLPGILSGVVIHDGPPSGPVQARVAIIQDHAAHTWAVTAAITHPGVGMADAHQRAGFGTGLADLLDGCVRTELIDEVLFIVRTVPDDAAERTLWSQRHRRPDAPAIALAISDQLTAGLAAASVRTEAFVTIVVPDARLSREAREFGRGIDARARVLLQLMGEVESQLRAGFGATSVAWLTSPELALAVRTGFASTERAGIIEAQAAAATDPGVDATIPWAQAGPGIAQANGRHYAHDAWLSTSSTLKLPDRGAALGALAPVLVPTDPGERRSLLVAFPLLAQSVADRQTANTEWAADMGDAVRAKAGIRRRARQRAEQARAHRLDDKLAHGNALARPYAVATVTVPRPAAISEAGRRLDASIRRAGFAPLRLDLAHDLGFAVSTIPLGASLTRRADR